MQTIFPAVRISTLCLCVLVSAGCLPKVVTRPQIVEIPVIKKQAMPADFLLPTPTPPTPAPGCYAQGEPVLCAGQLVEMLDARAQALDACNGDKAAGRAWISAGGGTP